MTTQGLQHNDDLSILLLEDYALDAELVKRHIRKTHPDWRVDHVKTKEAFVDYLEDRHPDIVLSDYSMPQFTGMEAFLQVKELGLEIPFIIVTGDLPEETAIECIKEGIDDYIIKSSLLRLDVAIQKAIQRKASEIAKRAIAEQLQASEERFKSIFDHAGVALIECSSAVEIKPLLKGKLENKVMKNTIKNLLDTLVVTAGNKAAVKLFDAPDFNALVDSFPRLFERSAIRILFQAIQRFSTGSTAVEQLIPVRTWKGHKRFVKTKVVYDPHRPSFFTVSFVDMTDTVEAEKRTIKMTERLEDTVAERMLELSQLNEKLRIDAEEREKITRVMRDNYIAMTESIIAAKRIQQLLLPSHSQIANGFADAFVYMRPKDIVSGDFYWYHEEGDVRWVACVDCTGHGVPGAFMSMISSKMLNQAVIENDISDPGQVLSNLNEYVVKELKQHDASTIISTGMDISLCKFDYRKMELSFSGAYQILYAKDENGLRSYAGDRRSLGGTFKHADKSFTVHTMPFKEGDCFYMSSDGFVDQFGGLKDKKFTRRRFIELLKSVDSENMYDQEMVIKSAFQDWKGPTEQIDDILVMGIRT
ncbi:SpoIIE family protein phosphatase [Sanyastnella coralliicola]|uniref:SpoIIE family protein phosphatase n=1 Tax=Sanyastnella coralliicola TaxID=3069118 RepID=UPI0027B92789|nr:SpoIIE family protein phosphatase [Longitalea sp. SCSIO 12813]